MNNIKVFIHIIVGIILRLLFYSSKLKNILISLLFFPSYAYNFDNLNENFFYNSIINQENNSTIYTKNNFISQPILIFYMKFKDIKKDYIFYFFIFIDVLISLLLYKIKTKLNKETNLDNNEKENHYIIAIYLFNPISILACVNFRLDIIYTLFNLLFVINIHNFILSSIFLFVSIIISPGYIFISIGYIIYYLLSDLKHAKNNIILLFIILICYLSSDKYLGYNTKKNLFEIYFNYYNVSDTLPNFSFIWSLLPGTFLKYQNYTKIMILIYQFSLVIAAMTITYRVNNKDYQFKNSLIYSIIFLINHIFDRYPSEIHYMIILILLFQHWDIIKVEILNLAVYCSIAGYTLIIVRGFPYIFRKSGTSNYLFFQNVTYEIAMTFILMCCLNGINNFRKKCKKRDKYGIIEEE